MADEAPTPDRPADDPGQNDDPQAPGDEPTEQMASDPTETTEAFEAPEAPEASAAADDAPDADAGADDAAAAPDADPAAAAAGPPPPRPAATAAPQSARRYLGVGVAALAVVVAAVVGYSVGNADSDDDGVPASFEDGPGDRGHGPDGERRDDGDWDDERGEDGDHRPGPPDGPDFPGGGDLPGGDRGRVLPQLPHGDGWPVFGTVSGVGDDSVEVETVDGDTITITISEDTDFTHVTEDGLDDDAGLSDVEEGDHVLVFPDDADEEGDDQDDEDDSDDTVAADDVIFGTDLPGEHVRLDD